MFTVTPLTAVFDCKMQAGCALYYSYPANNTHNNTFGFNIVLHQAVCYLDSNALLKHSLKVIQSVQLK